MHSRLQRIPSVFFCFLLWLSLGAGVFGLPAYLHAGSGNQISYEGHDLQVYVDFRWAGTGYGGYYPIRIQVQNSGPDCELTFRFRPHNGRELPIVERRNLPVASQKKATITLSVPMVGQEGVGYLEVERNGELLETLTKQLSLPAADDLPVRSSVLVISQVPVQLAALEIGLQSRRGGDLRNVSDSQVIEPIMLPNSWSDYSGLDMVMIPMGTLKDLESDKRSAILEWAQAGGVLVVYEVGAPADSSDELAKLLNLPEPRNWQNAKPNERDRYFIADAMLGSSQIVRDPSLALSDEHGRWNPSPETFAYQDTVLGRIYAFRDNPFPGTPTDWAWWLSTVPVEISSWDARTGAFPRAANHSFFNFLIPGVTSVPVYAFLVLMTIFTIVIGPLNYIFLRRRKRTYLLLLTIPVIAFVTSLTLFVYSTLAYGFSVASRSRSLTVVDQRINTSVSLSRVSLFAGMAPSEGLKFSPETAVYPMWAPLQFGQPQFGRSPFGQSQFESGRVIWGEQQELVDGWLRSRTRTQFATVQHRTERGRVEVESRSENRVVLSNGFEWDIAGILWADEDGNLYVGENLAAGSSAELERVEDTTFANQLERFQEILEHNQKLEMPDDIEEKKQPEFGLMELKIHDFIYIRQTMNGRVDSTVPPLGKRMYLAVLAERPGIELGLEDTTEYAGYHLLLGYY